MITDDLRNKFKTFTYHEKIVIRNMIINFWVFVIFEEPSQFKSFFECFAAPIQPRYAAKWSGRTLKMFIIHHSFELWDLLFSTFRTFDETRSSQRIQKLILECFGTCLTPQTLNRDDLGTFEKLYVLSYLWIFRCHFQSFRLFDDFRQLQANPNSFRECLRSH